MNIFILQKSITDLKNPVKKIAYRTAAVTLRDFLCEMVEKNAKKGKEQPDYVELFDALSKSGGALVYERNRAKFSVPEMREFVQTAFTDKLFILKNVTKNLQYEDLSQNLNLSENDEIVLIRLKYVRGAI